MDSRVVKWFKICDTLADNEIPFRETKSGVYLPDFEEYAKKIGKPLEFLNDLYVKCWEDYCEYVRTYFKGKKINGSFYKHMTGRK